MPRWTLVFAGLLLAGTAAAQTPGSCALGTAEGVLDVSNVQAHLFNTGSLFFGNTRTSGDGYLVPASNGHSPLFAAGLWLAGTVGGEVRAAGSQFTGFTFWPGPLDDGGALPNPADCSPYDRIYVVSEDDLADYGATGIPSQDLFDWPVGLGAPAVDASGDPVPVTSRSQRLNLRAGERPEIFGSQTAFWVMNDVGGPHTQLGTAPLGVEVRVIAYAIGGTELRGASEATFYRYTLVNRTANTIEDARAALWLDPDLGGATDDYIGTDPDRGMLFVYNSDDTDAAYGAPPAFGVDFLSGAASGRWLAKTSGPNTDPTTGIEMDRVLRGLWKDGTPVRAFGTGYGQPESAPVTVWQWPGDPVTESFWSEVNNDGEGTDNLSGDRRALLVDDAVTLAPGASHTIDFALLFAQGVDRFDSITELRAVSDAVQGAYDAGTLATFGGTLVARAAPVLVEPADASAPLWKESLAFEWEAVPGASAYSLSWAPSYPDRTGAVAGTRVVEGTQVVIPVADLAPVAGEQAIAWTVRALGSGVAWPSAPERTVRVFRRGTLARPNGEPAVVEVVAPGGGDPCEGGAQSTSGCGEGLGNPVYHSFNSTNAYYVSYAPAPRSPAGLVGRLGPNDVEIRFTAAGGLGTFDQDGRTTVVRVPFEVWDIGAVTPGAANDLSDDIRLVPTLFADNGGTCAFDAAEIPVGDAHFEPFVESDRLGAVYAATTYGAFADAFGPRVAGAAEGCYVAASSAEVAAYLTADRMMDGLVFGSSETSPAVPGTGTVVRLYAVDPPFGVSVAEDPGESGLDVSVSPNPSRAGATVRFALAEPGAVRVRLVDVLGREVAVLADGERGAGDHAVRLPAALAAGVYAVEVVAGARRASRLVTVVR